MMSFADDSMATAVGFTDDLLDGVTNLSLGSDQGDDSDDDDTASIVPGPRETYAHDVCPEFARADST